jgi:FkbM family methyltransferase
MVSEGATGLPHSEMRGRIGKFWFVGMVGMGYRRTLVRALDRPGCRGVLSVMINALARSYARNVRVYYRNGMWMHEEHDVIFVDSPKMQYHPAIFPPWANELENLNANVADLWFHAYKPHAGDVIVDAGAGKGEDAIGFSRAVGTSGRVLAIEAHPVTFRCLQMFCELNGLSNVTVVNVALIDGERQVAIENLEGWQANCIVDGETKGAIPVPGLTLDKVVERENVKRIDFLKMNIEGAEAMAIRGMEQTLRITLALCISCHDFCASEGKGEFFRTKKMIQGYIEKAGFRIVSRERDTRPAIACQVNAIRE